MSVWDDHDYGQNNAGAVFIYKPYFRELFAEAFRAHCEAAGYPTLPRKKELLLWDEASRARAPRADYDISGFPIAYLKEQQAALKADIEAQIREHGLANS